MPLKEAHECILVVEDEEIVRRLACEALTLLGYSTLAAGDPEEALKICDAHPGPIHLLLTDVVLPRMDGRTLFGLLSARRPESRVLYVSGYTENFIVRHGVLDRNVHFMQKPFTVENLAFKVRQVLDE
jgi:two-component system cell cycle sensor histidine kinase/response regulator CckA